MLDDFLTRAKMIKEAALKSLGRKLSILRGELRLALDPSENVRRRKVISGPAPEEVKRMIGDRWRKVKLEETRHRRDYGSWRRPTKSLEGWKEK